jgi:hypothetical protein
VWSEALEHREQVEKLLSDNRELYERYLALQDLRGYHDTARPSIFLPSGWDIGLVGQTRKLFLAELVLRMRGGAPNEQRAALADLGKDMRLWRIVLTGEGTMISTMVAVAYLQADYLVLADMIADDHTGSGRRIRPMGICSCGTPAGVKSAFRPWRASRPRLAVLHPGLATGRLTR